MATDDEAYMIEMKKNASKWFFVDLEQKDNVDKIIWTPAQTKATLFSSEEDVEEFKHHYLAPRKVSIIRIKYNMEFVLGG